MPHMQIFIPQRLKDLGFKENHIRRIDGGRKECSIIVDRLQSHYEELVTILESEDIDANFIASLAARAHIQGIEYVINTLIEEENRNKISDIKIYTHLETVSLGSILQNIGLSLLDAINFLDAEDTKTKITKIITRLGLKPTNFSTLFKSTYKKLTEVLDFLAQDDTLEAIETFTQEVGISIENFTHMLAGVCTEESFQKLLESKSMFLKLKSQLKIDGPDINLILNNGQSNFTYHLSVLSKDENIVKLKKFITSTKTDISTLTSLLCLGHLYLQKNIDLLSNDEFVSFYNKIKKYGFSANYIKGIFVPRTRNLEKRYEELKEIIDAYDIALDNQNLKLCFQKWSKIIAQSKDEVDFWQNVTKETGQDPFDFNGEERDLAVEPPAEEEESLPEPEIIDFINNVITPEGFSAEEKLPFYNWAIIESPEYVQTMINYIVLESHNCGMKHKYLRKILGAASPEEAQAKMENLYNVMDSPTQHGSIFHTIITYQNAGIKINCLIKFLCSPEGNLLENLDKLDYLITPNELGISPICLIVQEHGAEWLRNLVKTNFVQLDLSDFYQMIIDNANAILNEHKNQEVTSTEEVMDDEDKSLSEPEIIDFINNVITPEGFSAEEKLPFYNWAIIESPEYVQTMINYIVLESHNCGLQNIYLREMLKATFPAEAQAKMENLYNVIDAPTKSGSIFHTINTYQELGIEIDNLVKFLCDEEGDLVSNLNHLNHLILLNENGISPLSVISKGYGNEWLNDFAKESPNLSLFFGMAIEHANEILASNSNLNDSGIDLMETYNDNEEENINPIGNSMDYGSDEA